MRLCINHVLDKYEEQFSSVDHRQDIKRKMVESIAQELLDKQDHLIRSERDWAGNLRFSIELNFLSSLELDSIKSSERLRERVKHARFATDDFGNEIKIN